jgi:NHL repeat
MGIVFAGIREKSGTGDGMGKKARFNFPFGIAIDQQTGTLFISDFHNHNIRKITPQGNFFFSHR